ncbi:hypothetical protein SCALM49S_09183 [Streptomyces californicus]
MSRSSVARGCSSGGRGVAGGVGARRGAQLAHGRRGVNAVALDAAAPGWDAAAGQGEPSYQAPPTSLAAGPAGRGRPLAGRGVGGAGGSRLRGGGYSAAVRTFWCQRALPMAMAARAASSRASRTCAVVVERGGVAGAQQVHGAERLAVGDEGNREVGGARRTGRGPRRRRRRGRCAGGSRASQRATGAGPAGAYAAGDQPLRSVGGDLSHRVGGGGDLGGERGGDGQRPEELRALLGAGPDAAGEHVVQDVDRGDVREVRDRHLGEFPGGPLHAERRADPGGGVGEEREPFPGPLGLGGGQVPAR